MTIEQKINNLIIGLNEKSIPRKPLILNPTRPFWIPKITVWNSSTPIALYDRNTEDMQLINNVIDEADVAECLTSGVRYIRETKKKLMENK